MSRLEQEQIAKLKHEKKILRIQKSAAERRAEWYEYQYQQRQDAVEEIKGLCVSAHNLMGMSKMPVATRKSVAIFVSHIHELSRAACDPAT